MKLYRKVKRGVNKVKRWVFHPLRTGKSLARRRVRTIIRAGLVSYLLLLLPINVIDIKNNLPRVGSINFNQVVNQLKAKDLASYLTGGLSDYIGSKPTTQNLVNLSSNEDGDYYQVMGLSDINEDAFPRIGDIKYDGLDSYGRTLMARGTITHKMVQLRKGVRLPFEKNSDPIGFPDGRTVKNKKVAMKRPDGTIYHGEFYNRSHLIANQLGGEASRRNLITGTRAQNVGSGSGGMRYSEKKAVDYLDNNKDGVLYYEAKPIYEGEEVIPRYVDVRMKSKGGEIDEYIRVFNRQDGFSIDYGTGRFQAN